MARKIVLLPIIALLVLSLITPISFSSPITPVKPGKQIDLEWNEKIPKKLFDILDKDSELKIASAIPRGLKVEGILKLYNIDKAYHVIVIGEDDEETTLWIAQHSVKLLYKFSMIGGKALYYVAATKDQIKEIAMSPGVHRITPSLPIADLLKQDNRIEHVEGPIPRPVKALNTGENVSYLPGVQLIGATRVWSEYNITGKGVVVGIVDTGIDLSEPELGVDAIAREPDGTPLLMAQVTGLTITTTTATAINNTLITEGKWVLAFDPLYTYVFRYPIFFNITFDYNITLGENMTSQSGVYHIGLAPFMFADFVTGYFIRIFIPVVVYDSQLPGVYDKAVFDLSTSFYTLSVLMQELENETLGTIYWRTPDPEWYDNSVADEPVFGPGNEVVARDFDGDDIPDFSPGTIAGYYLDLYGLTGITPVNGTLFPGTPGLYPGWDYNGTYFALISDWHGHGTAVATVIAARGRFLYDIYGDGKLYKIVGVAPEAKLAGGDAWLLGDILVLEAWLAGSNLTVNVIDGQVYIGIDPFGPHRADIISNSWNHIYVNFWLQQFPGVDVKSAFIDSLLIARNIFMGDPVVIVFAAGNEGPGYSSVGTPSAGLLTVTVGASTLWDWIRIYGYPPGYADDIIPYSSRGPSGLGYPKPDVVNIGANEWAGQRTIDGRGWGASYDLFGGTSEATPFTSGVIALIFEAYNKTYGEKPDVVTTRILLKSTAKDIGYNVFAQGSGRVDAYTAVKTIIDGGWMAYIPEGIQEAFLENYGNLFGPYAPLIAQFLTDTAYYGVVPPGTSKNFTIFLRGFGEAKISAWNMILAKEYVVYEGVYTFDHMMFPVVPRWVYQDGDLLEVVMVVKNITPPLSRAIIIPPDDSHEIILSAYDWIDDNGDGIIGYPTELRYINFEARVSTEALLTISQPAQKIKGELVLRIRPNPFAVNITPAQIEVVVRVYKKVPCKVISFSSTTIDVSGIANVTATVSIPENFRPGVLEVAIEIETPSKKIILPASILVPLVLDSTATVRLGGVRSPMKYDPFALYGLADWKYGSWEGQDWRILPVMITDPSIVGATIVARWGSGATSDLAFLAVPPGGAYTPTGLTNTFAAYKLAYDLGMIYNPSLSDQMSMKLRLFLPSRWPVPLQDAPILITSLGDWPPYPGLIWVGDNNKLPTIYGVYRLIYAFTAYGGRLLEDKISLRIITIKARLEYESIGQFGDYDFGILHVYFEAGAYAPFLFADLYVYEPNYNVIPYGYDLYPVFLGLFDNGTAVDTITYVVLYDYAFYIEWSPYAKQLAVDIPVLINMTGLTEGDVMLVMYNYPWRSEGEYRYCPTVDELLIASWWMPGIATIQLIPG